MTTPTLTRALLAAALVAWLAAQLTTVPPLVLGAVLVLAAALPAIVFLREALEAAGWASRVEHPRSSHP